MSSSVQSLLLQDLQEIQSLFFKHPANCCISGPSGSGKTEFVKKIDRLQERSF